MPPPERDLGPFPAARSLLSPEALAAMVGRAYRLGPVRSCTLLRSLVNDVYALATDDGRYVLKVYGHGWRMAGEVTWEVELLARLLDKGLAAPAALPRADGDTVGLLAALEGPRAAVLFAWAEGERPAAPSAELYGAFGAALAVLLPRLAARPDDRAFVADLAARAGQRIAALAGRGLDWGVCHGDVTLDNLHVAPDGRLTRYDFDSAAPGWRAADPYGVMTWLVRGRPEFWAAFLAGYRSVRPLGEADLVALPWFVPVQALDNLRWHLSDVLALRGVASLDDGELDAELAALRRWQREVLADSDGAPG